METLKKNWHYLYLIFALTGGLFTFYYLALGVAEKGSMNSIDLIQSTWIDSFYAKSITLDFWTAAVAGTIFIFAEGLRLKMKGIWLYIAVTFVIAFAFSFPLFLFMRQREINKQKI